MNELNFDPVLGEEVRTRGFPGVFTIAAVYPPNWTTVPQGLAANSVGAEGGRTVDLRRVGSDSILRNIRWESLKYVDETRPVRRAIEWIRENPVVPFPDYVLDYQVEAKNDHQGNPSFYVRFFVEPDDQPGPEKIDQIHRFLGSVQTMLLSLGMDRWPYVQVSEKRSLLDVAS